jgi:hypothetical protein
LRGYCPQAYKKISVISSPPESPLPGNNLTIKLKLPKLTESPSLPRFWRVMRAPAHLVSQYNERRPRLPVPVLLMIFPVIFFCAKSNELVSTRHTSRHTRRAELVLNVIGKFFYIVISRQFRRRNYILIKSIAHIFLTVH